MSLRRLILAAFATLLLATPVLAADGDPKFPALTGDVVDDANVLSPATEAVLTRELADLRHGTGHRLVVVTVSSLQGRDIADYGIRLFRDWKVGRAGQDDGAILLIAPNERTDRIEVGYKLEPVLTDAASKAILTDLRPRLRVGDYDGAALLGERAIASLISTPGQAPPPRPSADLPVPFWVWLILGFFALLLVGAACLVIWAVRAAIRSAMDARAMARAAKAGVRTPKGARFAEQIQEEFDANWNAQQQAFEQRKAEINAQFEAAREASRARSSGASDAAAAAAAAAAAGAAIPPDPVLPDPVGPDPWATPEPAAASDPWPSWPAAPAVPDTSWPEPPTPAPAAPDDSGAYTGGSAGGGGADDKW